MLVFLFKFVSMHGLVLGNVHIYGHLMHLRSEQIEASAD